MLALASPTGRAARYPWSGILLTPERPSVGDLMRLCEENYAWLKRLAPGLADWRGEFQSLGRDGVELHLEVIEQSPYTSLLRLTYLFPQLDGQEHRIPLADPDALLRAYHCLLYTSDAADERSSVDLGGRRIIKKKTNIDNVSHIRRHLERHT